MTSSIRFPFPRKHASRLRFFSITAGLNAIFLFWIPEISLTLSALGFVLGLVAVLNSIVARTRSGIAMPSIAVMLSILAVVPAVAFKYGRDHAFAQTAEVINEFGGSHEVREGTEQKSSSNEQRSERNSGKTLNELRSRIEDTFTILLIRMGGGGLLALALLWLLALSATNTLQGVLERYNESILRNLHRKLSKSGHQIKYDGFLTCRPFLFVALNFSSKLSSFRAKILEKVMEIMLGPLINPLVIGICLHNTFSVWQAEDPLDTGDIEPALNLLARIKGTRERLSRYCQVVGNRRSIPINIVFLLITGLVLCFLVGTSISPGELIYGTSRLDAYLASRHFVRKTLSDYQNISFDSYFEDGVSVREIGSNMVEVRGCVQTALQKNVTCKVYICRLRRNKHGGWEFISLDFPVSNDK